MPRKASRPSLRKVSPRRLSQIRRKAATQTPRKPRQEKSIYEAVANRTIKSDLSLFWERPTPSKHRASSSLRSSPFPSSSSPRSTNPAEAESLSGTQSATSSFVPPSSSSPSTTHPQQSQPQAPEPPNLQTLLPDSDLLAALHAYASDFYSKSLAPREAELCYRFMDETALLALGVLMEEMCKTLLGKTGDLAFVEGLPKEEVEAERAAERAREFDAKGEGEEEEVSDHRGEDEEGRSRKRRKVDGGDALVGEMGRESNSGDESAGWESYEDDEESDYDEAG